MVFISRSARNAFFGAILVYLFVPIVAVLIYSFSTRWTSHILPDGYTLGHWGDALRDERLRGALLRSVGMACAVLLLDIALVVPAVFWQRVRNPRIRIATELLAAIPFVLPFVVIAYGILRLLGTSGPDALRDVAEPLPNVMGHRVAAVADWLPTLLGTPWLILFAHAAVAFPFLYWAVDGAMAGANIGRLNDAAQACGATSLQTLRYVVFPNIGAGLAAGGMLVFATSFGEFALVQILAGARFENVSLYSLDLFLNTTSQAEKLAVLTIMSFAMLFVVSVAVVYLNRGQSARLMPAGSGLEDRR